jgi:hypothetical protein
MTFSINKSALLAGMAQGLVCLQFRGRGWLLGVRPVLYCPIITQHTPTPSGKELPSDLQLITSVLPFLVLTPTTFKLYRFWSLQYSTSAPLLLFVFIPASHAFRRW